VIGGSFIRQAQREKAGKLWRNSTAVTVAHPPVPTTTTSTLSLTSLFAISKQWHLQERMYTVL
jgi:hypothetical protein